MKLPLKILVLMIGLGMISCAGLPGCGRAVPEPNSQQPAATVANNTTGGTVQPPAQGASSTAPPITDSVNFVPKSVVPAGTPVAAPTTAPIPLAAADSAVGILQRMAQAYRVAETYADQAYVRQKFVRNGQEFTLEQPLQVAFARPNKLRLECYTLKLVNDGQTVRGAVENTEGVLELPAPGQLTLDNLVLDATMQNIINQGFAGTPLQPLLLLGDDALSMIYQPSLQPRLAVEGRHENRLCHRVEIPSPAGVLTLWIDQESYILRRADYPLDGLRGELEKGGPVSDLQMFADFSQAQFNSRLAPEAFQFAVPPGALLVKRLISFPPPLSPTPLLGKPVPNFEFVARNGDKITPQTMRGKIQVLLFWGVDNPASRQILPLFAELAQRYGEMSAQLAFTPVNVDDAQVTNETIANTLSQLNITLPTLRDPQLDAKKSLGVDVIPSLLVLDAAGNIEHHWPELLLNMASTLPPFLDALLAGKSTAAASFEDFQLRLAEYRRYQQMPPQAPGTVAEIPLAPAATQASAPSKHRLEPLWKSSAGQLAQGGNILVIEAGAGDPQVLVLDGSQAVCQFDSAGKLIQRHELGLPPQTPVTTLRTAVGANGQRSYLLFHPFEKHVHLFNEQWQKTLSYPQPQQQGQDQITDAQLIDLDGDGELEIALSYTGLTGVRLAKLDGTDLGGNRKDIQFGLRLAYSEPDAQRQRLLFCSTAQGNIVPLDFQLRAATPWTIPDVRLFGIVGGDVQPLGVRQYLGYTLAASSATRLLALDKTGKPLWSYDLPAGVHQVPIDFLCTTPLVGQANRAWLMAGADGSIHLVDAAGTLIDKFATGQVLSGIGGYVTADGRQSVILTSSGQELTAWKLTPLESASQK
ncbi:MAG: redoxin domain-containing protein [Pirellulales bacterium]|nr:redoxin domain-containing protein [Pirellulales bacterium]